MATLYILHFDRPYWRNCQHYVGYTKLPLEERLKKHRSGTGARLVKYAIKHGNDFRVAYTEEFDTPIEARRKELKLKKERHLPRYCKYCMEDK